MGTVITIVLAVVIFGIGLSVFYKTLHKEVVHGVCAGCSGCGSEKSCPSKSAVKIQKMDESKFK